MKVTVLYFAMLREQAGCREENVDTEAATPAELYAELQARHGFVSPPENLKAAIDHEMADWQRPLQDGQTVSFIPPVAGGAPCSR